MSEIELLPCPFCGKEEAQAVQNPNTTYWGVICFWCEVSNFGVTYFSKEEAETAWNRRAPADPTPAMFDTAAAQLAAQLEQDAQEALDKIAVMDWMLTYGGEMAGSIQESVYLGIGHFFADIHQAADWIRTQGGKNGQAER